MSRAGWESKWKKVRGKTFVGGQGRSFLARADSGEIVFVKELLHNERRAARGRFAREVQAYETLQHSGLPKLIEHNGRDWQDRVVVLYLVLEYVEGLTLADSIRLHAPAAPEDAFRLACRLSEIVEFCHDNDVVHRDLKPTNLLLRCNDLGDPVVVDFGLSFNGQEPDASDLTRVDEEVGNRFLRLPEHSTGGRSPVSDVTQMAALYFYALTGIEPRVLVDAEGLKPHLRPGAVEILNSAFVGQRLRRIQSLFDQAFDPRLDRRFQTAAQFRQSLRYAHAPAEVRQDMKEMLERLGHVTALPSHAEPADNAAVLQRFWKRAIAVARAFASRQKLECTQSGGPHNYSADPPFSILQLALTRPHEVADERIQYEFQRASPASVILRVGGDVRWRGDDEFAPEFEDAVIQPILSLFLQQAGG